jgi:hypothetical protein
MRIIDLHCYPGTTEWKNILHDNAERILGL